MTLRMPSLKQSFGPCPVSDMPGHKFNQHDRCCVVYHGLDASRWYSNIFRAEFYTRTESLNHFSELVREFVDQLNSEEDLLSIEIDGIAIDLLLEQYHYWPKSIVNFIFNRIKIVPFFIHYRFVIYLLRQQNLSKQHITEYVDQCLNGEVSGPSQFLPTSWCYGSLLTGAIERASKSHIEKLYLISVLGEKRKGEFHAYDPYDFIRIRQQLEAKASELKFDISNIQRKTCLL